MPPKKKTNWLLVGDAAKAQLYSISAIPLRLRKVPAGAFRTTRKATRGPEHRAETTRIAHVGNGHGQHQRREGVFVERVAAAIDAASSDGAFDSIIVVLPPKALAHFRKIVSPAVRKKIKQEIRSEWTHLTMPDIEKHLTARLP